MLTIYNSPKVETIQMPIIWQVRKQNWVYPYTLYSNQEYSNTILIDAKQLELASDPTS